MKQKIDNLDKLDHETFHKLMGYVAGYRIQQGVGCLTNEMVDFAAYVLKTNKENPLTCAKLVIY